MAQTPKITPVKVDFDHVKEVINKPGNLYWYPDLLKKFLSNDTTMTLEEYRNFYYGYTFQEDYDPYRESTYSQRVEDLYYQKNFTREDKDSIEFYAEKSLKDNMFDLEQRQFYAFALREKGKRAKFKVHEFILERFILTIMSSGKGTEDMPWVVICPDHEYNLINWLGYVAIDHQIVGDGIEYIQVQTDSDSETKGFYFDVRRINEVEAVKWIE